MEIFALIGRFKNKELIERQFKRAATTQHNIDHLKLSDSAFLENWNSVVGGKNKPVVKCNGQAFFERTLIGVEHQ